MRHVGGGETERNVLVDVNNLLYRAYFAFVKDREKNGMKPLVARLPDGRGGMLDMDTGVIQGSLRILSSWLYDIQSPSKIVAFFDGLPARRTSLFPDYKKRDKDDVKQSVHVESPGDHAVRLRDGTEVHGPVSALAYVLRLLGCDVYHHPGEEADDLIATFVRRDSEAVNVIMSSDKDFFQLVGGRTVVYRPGPETPRLHDAERVEDTMEKRYKVRVKPTEIRMFKALTGDSSDGIPGVHGLRKKSAHPMCRFASVDEVYDSGLPGFSKGEQAKAVAWRSQVELNYRLVGFYDQLDLASCLQPEKADFPLAAKILREDLSLTDVDLLPFRVGRHSVKPIRSVPDWLADV
jgi:5'-3' exonuclease